MKDCYKVTRIGAKTISQPRNSSIRFVRFSETISQNLSLADQKSQKYSKTMDVAIKRCSLKQTFWETQCREKVQEGEIFFKLFGKS